MDGITKLLEKQEIIKVIAEILIRENEAVLRINRKSGTVQIYEQKLSVRHKETVKK